MTNYTQNGPQKKLTVDRWRHRAGLVNQGATLVFGCFSPALVNDCTMHDAFIRCCHQTRKLLMCAPDMLHPFQLESGLTMTYHDLPTAVFFGGAKSKGQNQYVEVVGSSSSVPLGRNGFDFRCLFELLVHLNPLQQGALRTGDSPDAYRNPSAWLSRTQVGHVAQVQTYEIPN